jgi:CPA2 family monovalent cation:H+ antiporter-2
MHNLSLITTIAVGLTAAWVLGLLARRLGLSPIVGYLGAGVVIGPFTPGFVGDLEIAHQLAELGVILLMFGVGLHFHVKDLWAVKGVAIPGAVGQSLVAAVVSAVLFYEFGMPVRTGLVLGMAMAVASTVVLMRVLMDADSLDTPQGHVAVGWLIVEDIFTVVLLVLIPVLGGDPTTTAEGAEHGLSFWPALGWALVKLGALFALLLVLGAKIVPWVLVRVAKLRSRELFTLTVLVFSIAVAAGSFFVFGASMALGAFLAGMVVAQSSASHQAAADILPLRDAFAVLFFVSVGMLFDPRFLIEQPLMLSAALGVILLAKPAAALVIVALLGQPVRTALTVAVGLAQIGEFSFILASDAGRHGLMTEQGTSLLVAASIVSITLNPFLFRSLPKMERWLQGRPWLWRILNARAERRMTSLNHDAAAAVERSAATGGRLAVVVGFGPVGRSVHRLLEDAGLSTVVIDMNMDTVATLNAEGRTAIFGDASHDGILTGAGVDRASHVVVTLPGAADRAAVVTAVRNMNPTARLFVRARYLGERNELESSGATAAVFEEAEAAVALARLVLADTGVHREAAEKKLRDLRMQLLMENVSNFRTQRVGSVMIPWSRVRRLPSSAGRDEVLREIAGARFSRWPVTDAKTGSVLGYLLMKDLIAEAATEDWKRHLRPLRAIRPDDDVESTLARMQRDGVSLFVVEEAERPVGLITLEDILEQVVGRIEDEYPHEAPVSLAAAVRRGGVVLELESGTRDDLVRELVAAVPNRQLPIEAERQRIVERALAREASCSTDLGDGAAVPHARCPHLREPAAVIGRSSGGVEFSADAAVPVRLFFLLLTPSDDPEAQLTLLSEVGGVLADPERRRRLLEATSAEEIAAAVEAPAVQARPAGAPVGG